MSAPAAAEKPASPSLQAVARRLTKESSMVFARTVLLKGVTIVSSIILARILGAENLGIWALVTATAGLAWIVAELGIGVAGVTVVSEVKEDPDSRHRAESTALFLALGVGGAIVAVYAALSPVFAFALYGIPEALPLFLLSAATMAVNLSSNVFSTFLQAHRRISLLAITGFVLGALNAVALVIGAITLGLLGAFLAALATNAVSAVVYWVILRRERAAVWSPRSFDRGYARQLMGLGAPSVVSSLIGLGGSWAALTLLGVMGRLDQVGHYNVAWRAASFVLFPSSAVFVVLFPMAAETFRVDPTLFRRTFRETMRYTIMAVIPLSLLLALLAPEVIALLYGAGYASAAPLLALLVPAGFLISLTAYSSTLFYVTRSVAWGAVMISIVTALQVGTAAILIPAYGVVGVAVSTLVTWFAAASLTPPFLRGKPGYEEVLWGFSWALVAAAGLLAAGLISTGWPLVPRAILLVVTLATFLLGLRSFVINDADRRFFRSLLAGASRRFRLR